MLVHSGIQSRQSSLRFLFAALFITPILQVGFYVKVDEQSHHNEGVKHHDPFRPSWIFTTVVQQGKKARHYDHGELRQLKLGNVTLPPKVRPHLRTDRRQTIISIHDHVNKAIACSTEVRDTTGYPFTHHPPEHTHAGVVIYVQE